MGSLKRRVVVVFLLGLLPIASAAVAGPRRFVSVDVPGAVSTYGFGINASGDIVGSYVDNAGYRQGFVLRNGTFELFAYPGATWTEAYGINPRGDVVGQYGLPDNTIHGFLLRNGSLYPIDVPGQPTDRGPANTMLVKINPEGTIAGCYHQSTPSGATILDTMHGFVMTADGAVTSYPQARTMHNGINSSGAIAGNYFDSTNTSRQSYVIVDGVMTLFSVPGALVTRAWDINASGSVVGFYRDASKNSHGFLLRDGEITSFDADFPGVKQTLAYGINPAGDIVGYYQDATGSHAFVLTRQDAR